MVANDKYKVSGHHTTGYAVVAVEGGILYDLLDTHKEAAIIRDLLNEEKGPDWDAIQSEFEARLGA